MVWVRQGFCFRQAVWLTFVLLLVGFSSTRAQAQPDSGASARGLGLVTSDGLTVEGTQLPAGSTLLAGGLLRTNNRPATLHLRGGQVLRLASHSSAFFEPAAVGNLRVDVRSGKITLRGSEAEARTVDENMYAVLSGDGTSQVGYLSASLSPTAGPSPAASASPRPAANSMRQVGSGAPVGAPVITEAETTCVPGVPYPIMAAAIRPGPDVRVAKVYFRADQSPHFYAVEMTGNANDFVATLPAPSADTARVVYYVEAVGNSFESSRTEEYSAEVLGEEACRERGGTNPSDDPDPEIIVFSTVPGAAALPAGFSSGGIAATVNAAGVATAVGAAGGLGTGAIVGIVAGGVVGGGILIEELDDDEPPASRITP